MNQELQSIFDSLAEGIRGQSFGEEDIYDIIGGFASMGAEHPMMARIASAMAFHVKDIFQESQEEMAYCEVAVEMYRRTFFDETYAVRYGTSNIMSQNQLIGLAKTVGGNLSMDSEADARGAHQAPSQAH